MEVFKFGFVGGFPPYRRGDLWSPDNIKIDIRQHFLYLRATTGRPYGVGYLFDKPQFANKKAETVGGTVSAGLFDRSQPVLAQMGGQLAGVGEGIRGGFHSLGGHMPLGGGLYL